MRLFFFLFLVSLFSCMNSISVVFLLITYADPNDHLLLFYVAFVFCGALSCCADTMPFTQNVLYTCPVTLYVELYFQSHGS